MGDGVGKVLRGVIFDEKPGKRIDEVSNDVYSLEELQKIVNKVSIHWLKTKSEIKSFIIDLRFSCLD